MEGRGLFQRTGNGTRMQPRVVNGVKPCRGPSSGVGLSGLHLLGGNLTRESGAPRGVTACRRRRFFVGCPRCGKGSSLVPPGLGLPRRRGSVEQRNAANSGWLGLQNIRSRHAEQTVEVVRNHEGGTCSKRGSELPRTAFVKGLAVCKHSRF